MYEVRLSSPHLSGYNSTSFQNLATPLGLILALKTHVISHEPNKDLLSTPYCTLQFTNNANLATMVVHVPFYYNKLTHIQEDEVTHTYNLIEAKISMEMRE